MKNCDDDFMNEYFYYDSDFETKQYLFHYHKKKDNELALFMGVLIGTFYVCGSIYDQSRRRKKTAKLLMWSKQNRTR